KCAAKDQLANSSPSCISLQHHRVWIIGRHSTASWNCPTICRLLLFTADLILSIRAQHTRTKGEDKIFWQLTEWVRELKFSRSKRGVSNNATQDAFMNAHNKTQFSYAKIKCALKDSSCDSPISTNLMLTILASNASSSLTKMLKCPSHKE
ncbi:hypothetical protein H5410_036161, partial [Solanum commersonii]